MKTHKVFNGIDRPELMDAAILGGARVGLAAGGAAVDRMMRPAADVLHERYNVTALYNMIYGIRGEHIYSERVPQYTDSVTGLPVYSIFNRDGLAPSPRMLADVDIIVFDAREAGTRYYEYLASAGAMMKACAKAGRPLVVLDRLNPINGVDAEGTVCPPGMHTIVGDYGLATRTGLTMGEFCRYINGEYGIGCDLNVVPVAGWSRDMYYDDTDLPYVLPSPSLPGTISNLLYPGMCLFEGVATISEGRGTTKPFELIGAPWLDHQEIVRRANRRGLGGVLFGATYFKPVSDKHKGEVCRAVQIHVTDRGEFESLRTALTLLEEIMQLHGEQVQWRDCGAGHDIPDMDSRPHFDRYADKLLADTRFTSGELTADALLSAHAPALAEYKRRKEKYHLY